MSEKQVVDYAGRPVAKELVEYPFAVVDGHEFHGITCTVDDRCAKVKASTDRGWLERVLRCRDLQATVRVAAQRRLRKLAKVLSPKSRV